MVNKKKFKEKFFGLASEKQTKNRENTKKRPLCSPKCFNKTTLGTFKDVRNQNTIGDQLKLHFTYNNTFG